jgi:hypothetical protein
VEVLVDKGNSEARYIRKPNPEGVGKMNHQKGLPRRQINTVSCQLFHLAIGTSLSSRCVICNFEGLRHILKEMDVIWLDF